ncbi:unnamed protein product [Clonostachys rosea]|uniref:Phytanoyl-CoA dioxygenase n=1 Tax=Bionectria ochroleuca TaxID=29856 RepID=A0ABY6UW76_BIOOC|nr:unnamed protein product [Clonostachys rosea]
MAVAAEKPTIVRVDATNPEITPEKLVEILERDGGVIVENLISRELAGEIRRDLKPLFDRDIPDKYGLFPPTTQRATGLLADSDACVELVCNKLFTDVANIMVSSYHTMWRGDKQVTIGGKPILSAALGFRVNPGGKQQVLHRDDNDHHPKPGEALTMISCVTALTKTTKENGATVAIPGSHLWGPERRPLEEEAVPVELEVGGALIFLGTLYHAGGSNITKDDYRETLGTFLCKPTLRPTENFFLEIPVERVRQMKPQAQRLLGYGVCEPGIGFMHYQDPMRALFGVEDEETVDM